MSHIEDYIDSKKEEIIKEVCEIVKIPSVNEISTDTNKPFGENVNQALEHFLKLGERLGFRTKNIDGYCGYVEFGEGDELLGIIGHLDVVPAGDGWTHKPFEPEISGGKIYGRGTTDDKGPVIASLYAMKAVKDLFEVNKRVRLIVGLNEENDWKCIDHYKAVEEMPTIGFSPDADFPCIYAEKGLLSVYISEDLDENENVIIKNIDTKNNAINVVPKYCSISLEIKDKLLLDKINSDILEIAKEKSFEIETAIKDKNLKIESFGKAAHAAHPELGINAISRLVLVLNKAFKVNNINNDFIKLLSDKINLETDGKSLGINFKDEMGELTLNLARLYIEDNKIIAGANLRVPVTINIDNVENEIKKSLSCENVDILFKDRKDSLYIPKENELVKKLCKIYNDYYGKNEEPLAIGGATYARAFKRCVSFGAMMPNEEDMCHKADEFIKIDYLLDSCKIYAKAIYELAK